MTIAISFPAFPASAIPTAVTKVRPAAAIRNWPASRVPTPLTMRQAAARARVTGRTVTVSSMTTPTSRTTVSPRGRFTTTESLVPVRARRDGRWYALNPALHRAPDGRLASAVTPDNVTLSGGGSAPLAVMSNYGRTLAISWPATLPAPSVSGASATYPGVPVSGANLIVTVSPVGTVSTVIE